MDLFVTSGRAPSDYGEDTLRSMMTEALKQFGGVKTADQAVELIQAIQKHRWPPMVYLEVEANAQRKDVNLIYPEVGLRQAELRAANHHSPVRRRRKWRKYKRDVTVYEASQQGRTRISAAYDTYQKEHPEEEPGSNNPPIYMALRKIRRRQKANTAT